MYTSCGLGLHSFELFNEMNHLSKNNVLVHFIISSLGLASLSFGVYVADLSHIAHICRGLPGSILMFSIMVIGEGMVHIKVVLEKMEQ